jgi:glycosyltransferase involved in cell wall biosynthesis
VISSALAAVDSGQLRVLAITPYPMVPTVSGGRLRSFHLVSELLRRGHKVTNWVVSEDDDPLTWSDDPTKPALLHIPARRRIGLSRKLEGLLSRYPEGPWACPPPASLAESLDTFDVAVLFQAHVGRFAAPLIEAGIPVVYSAENVEGELARRLAPLALTRMSGIRFRLDAWKFRRFEASLLRQASLVTTVSERDAAQLRQLVPNAHIAVLPSGADVRGVSFADHSDNRGDVVIFVGTLGYLPNRDGVTWLVDRILPLVRSRRPQVTIRLVGSSPPDTLRTLHGDGVELVGLVPDVRPELASADLFVAPLRAGAGTRLKILEAFAAGIPVVATSMAAEGIAAVDGTHLVIADDERAFADAMVDLLVDPASRSRMALAARQLVEDRYDWAVIGGRFESMLRDVVTARMQGRDAASGSRPPRSA